MKPRKINAFDAKTHLGELLRDAEAGRSYTITRRGKPVAKLSPVDEETKSTDWKKIAADFRKLREQIRKRVGNVDVRELVKEAKKR